MPLPKTEYLSILCHILVLSHGTILHLLLKIIKLLSNTVLSNFIRKKLIRLYSLTFQCQIFSEGDCYLKMKQVKP